MSGDTTDEDSKVGYGKPPLHSRFQKGQSGNPAGRKKGVRSLNQEVNDVLNAKVVVNQNGRRHRMTKREAVLTQAVNKAVQGDAKMTKLTLDLAREFDREEAMKAVLDATDKAEAAQVRIFELPSNGR